MSKICSQGLAICRSVIDPVRRCLNVCQHPGREIVQKSDAESDHETESYVQDVCVSDSSEDPNPKIQNSHAAEQSLKRKDTNSKDLVVDVSSYHAGITLNACVYIIGVNSSL